MSKIKMQRWGVLGTGMIARKFADNLMHSHPGCLANVGSRNLSKAGAFAEEFGMPSSGGYMDVLKDRSVESVYIALPNGMHHEWAIKALNSGKNVLCEKPIASNKREAEEMYAVANSTGKVLVEAFMYRTDPAIINLLDLVHSGEIGDVRLIRSNFSFARDIDQDDARYDPMQAGGSLMDVGCYCVNFCRAIVGMNPNEVSAFAHIHSSGVDDYAAGLLKFGDETLATFTCGMTVKNDWSTFIAGTKGQIRIENPWFSEGKFTVSHPQGIRKLEFKSPMEPYSREAEAFSSIVEGDTLPWITAMDTIGNMRTLDALRKHANVQFPE
jgi:xylose dehydrogenase (NAD/NADP)